MRNPDRFIGCLIGGAAGDALGYAVEFMREKDIFSRYGKKGITEYSHEHGPARISDDTQMTLFTAAGLLLGTERGMAADDPCSFADSVNDAYLDWYKTQTQSRLETEGAFFTPLGSIPALFSCRAPGNTCLSALSAGGGGRFDEPLNQSKGCGGVMRAAPVGLYFIDTGADIEDICRLGAQTAVLTHGHPLGWLPGGALAVIVHDLAAGETDIAKSSYHALETLERIWPDLPARTRFSGLIENALRLAKSGGDTLDAIHELGEGWVGDEALAIALFCAERYSGDIDKTLIASVNHKSDSDSTGAVAGNIVGAQVGLDGIPQKYTEDLELYDLLKRMANALCGMTSL